MRYPHYPDNFLTDVQPHLCRYILAEGKRLVKTTIHAVYSVLILSDPRTEASTEAEVAHKFRHKGKCLLLERYNLTSGRSGPDVDGAA